MQTQLRDVFNRIEAFLLDYCAFPDPGAQAPVVALWCLGTWVYRAFDAFPYLVITAATKQAGKTRLAELMSMVSHAPKNFAAVTPAVICRTLLDAKDGVTIFFDEAEQLSGESAGFMRSVLNVGYRSGQTVPRLVNNVVVDFPAYCPKAFILIGDVFDTLRDRSIMIELRRGTPKRQFRFAEAEARAHTICKELSALAPLLREQLGPTAFPDFLDGREQEIWAPLLTLAEMVIPARLDDITRAAVDLGADKTAPKRRYLELEADADAEGAQFGERVLRDMALVMGESPKMFTDDLIRHLRDIPTAPWRRFRGTGLTGMTLSGLVSRFGVESRLIRAPRAGGRVDAVRRGYRLADVRRGLAKLGKDGK